MKIVDVSIRMEGMTLRLVITHARMTRFIIHMTSFAIVGT
jgi:hypothetical protein